MAKKESWGRTSGGKGIENHDQDILYETKSFSIKMGELFTALSTMLFSP